MFTWLNKINVVLEVETEAGYANIQQPVYGFNDLTKV